MGNRRSSWLALAAVSTAALLAGCGHRQVALTAPFDQAAAKKMLEPGPNTVRGSGLIRKLNGGVVTCAGGTVFLMPRTDAAKEWATTLYGSVEGGAFPATGRVTFKPQPGFFETARSTTCDAQGFFTFDKVADGDFLVFTRITWRTVDSLEGGSVMRAVHLAGGATVTVTLAP